MLGLQIDTTGGQNNLPHPVRENHVHRKLDYRSNKQHSTEYMATAEEGCVMDGTDVASRATRSEGPDRCCTTSRTGRTGQQRPEQWQRDRQFHRGMMVWRPYRTHRITNVLY